MNPRFLQSKIHSEKSSSQSVWNDYFTEVVNEYSAAVSLEDFNDHLIREFNRRVYNLGFYSLLITPYDAGFRLRGIYDGAGPAVPTNALVYNSDYLVYNGDYLVYGA
jgi:hypothetical protein